MKPLKTNPDSPLVIDRQIACEYPNLPSQQDLETWIWQTLIEQPIEAELTVRFIDEQEMRHLNKTYRKKDAPTNVLAFPCHETMDLELPLLGDILLCPTIIEKEASEQHKQLSHHFAHLVIHGMLHLLGYDHQNPSDTKVMETLEINTLKQLGIPNPYE